MRTPLPRTVRCMTAMAALMFTAACDDRGAPVFEPPPEESPIVLQADVNVQMGNTPAGQQPVFNVTGQAVALRAGVDHPASVDSVLVYWSADAATTWTRLMRATAFPFSAALPITVQQGQQYRVWAIVHASAGSGAARVTARDEWVATGVATAP